MSKLPLSLAVAVGKPQVYLRLFKKQKNSLHLANHLPRHVTRPHSIFSFTLFFS
jgi:hypothetical protein